MQETEIVQNVPLSERLKTSFIGEDTTEQSYLNTPISQFGLNMLTQMGWYEGRGIGKNTQNSIAQPIQFIPRTQYEGLGVTIRLDKEILQKHLRGETLTKQEQQLYDRATKVNQNSAYQPSKNYRGLDDKLVVKCVTIGKGSRVSIINGPHKGFYGRVVSEQDEKATTKEWVVELAVNEQAVRVKEAHMVLIEFNETQQKQKQQSKNGMQFQSKQTAIQQLISSGGEEEDKNQEGENDNARQQMQQQMGLGQKKLKMENNEAQLIDNDNEMKQITTKKKKRKLKWVLPNIRVKVTSKKFQHGRLYNTQLIVTDKIDLYTFHSFDPVTSQSIECLREKEIETCLPALGHNVLILRDAKRNTIQAKGKLAVLKSRDKKHNKVIVQLIDSLDLMELTQDDVAEYVPATQ